MTSMDFLCDSVFLCRFHLMGPGSMLLTAGSKASIMDLAQHRYSRHMYCVN